MDSKRKITLIGGGGVRTPLLIHGLAEAASTLHLHELALYDMDAARVALMAELGFHHHDAHATRRRRRGRKLHLAQHSRRRHGGARAR
jgi:alpha-galactosidase/6-phospho-beta-glucosidase family protein